MKRNLLSAATMCIGVLLTACVATHEVEEPQVKTVATNNTPVPIDFDTYYVGRPADTRLIVTPDLPTGGVPGNIDTVDKLRAAGFSVFGYYTDGADYAAATKPNYMFNQQIAYDNTKTAWTYSPIKFWPNETTTDGKGGTSDHSDKLSFFAYAPYANEVVAKPQANPTDPIEYYAPAEDRSHTHWGVVQYPDPAVVGDPKIWYAPSTVTTKSIDLLWGVAPDNGTGGDATYQTINGGTITLPKGLPMKNLIKPAAGQKVMFHFKHALARMNVKVKADFSAHAADAVTMANTMIDIDKIEITGNFPKRAALNLNNTTADKPLWTDAEYDANGQHTYVLDERSFKEVYVFDAAHSSADTQFNQGKANDIMNAPEYKDLLINMPKLGDATATEPSYLMIIPNPDNVATTTLEVKFTYSVVTRYGAAAPYEYRFVEQTTVGNAVIAPKIEAGKTYTLNCLIKGFDAIQFNVTVNDDWQEPVVFTEPTVNGWDHTPHNEDLPFTTP